MSSLGTRSDRYDLAAASTCCERVALNIASSWSIDSFGRPRLARHVAALLRRGDGRRRRGDQVDLPGALGEDAVDELLGQRRGVDDAGVFIAGHRLLEDDESGVRDGAEDDDRGDAGDEHEAAAQRLRGPSARQALGSDRIVVLGR